MEENIHGDFQEVVVKDEEIFCEQQESSSTLDPEEAPEAAQIKEEWEELWISQERELLQGAEEEDINVLTFSPVTVKTEEEDGEKPLTSQLYENQSGENRETEKCLKTEAGGGDWRGSEADRDLKTHSNLYPVTPDETSDLSESGTDNSADFEESDEPQEGLNHLPNKDGTVSDVKLNTGNASDNPECAPDFDQKQKQHQGENLLGCSFCGKTYLCKKNLKHHMLRHSAEKRFSCSVCQKSFLWKVEMVRHMRVHTGEKPLSCSVCGKTFSCHGNLKIHSTTHTGEKPFSCSFCGKSFSQHVSLRNHSVIHTGEKPFSCSVCGKGFSQHSSLKRHSVVHTGEKQFSCSVCGKGFSQHESLRKHSVIHTGEKPFSCSICGKSFSQNGSLTLHSLVHTGEKPFSCSVCGRSFSQNGSLKRHSVVHTRETV